MMTGRLVLGSTVIANYITVTTDSKTSVHRGKGQNMLFDMLSQEVHNKMPMLPSEETLLINEKYVKCMLLMTLMQNVSTLLECKTIL